MAEAVFKSASDIAQKHGADANSDYRDIIPLVDVISLVVPTSQHYKIAREFLEAGIHCLIKIIHHRLRGWRNRQPNRLQALS